MMTTTLTPLARAIATISLSLFVTSTDAEACEANKREHVLGYLAVDDESILPYSQKSTRRAREQDASALVLPSAHCRRPSKALLGAGAAPPPASGGAGSAVV